MHGKVLLTIVSCLATSALAQPCANYACDSQSVRAILDANGRDSVRVEAVSSSSGGRIISLDLHGQWLSSVPDAIGSLSALVSLDIANNPALHTLPQSVSGLTSLRQLYAYYSGLTSLPGNLRALSSLKVARFWANPLDSVPDTVASWLDSTYRWWRCPIEATLPQDGAVYHVGDTLFVTWAVDSSTITCLCLQVSTDSGENFVSPVPSGCLEPHSATSGITAVPITASWVATGSAMVRVYAFVDVQLAVFSGYFSVLPASNVAGRAVQRAQVRSRSATALGNRFFDLTGRATTSGASGVCVRVPQLGSPCLRLGVGPAAAALHGD
jgi:hypothetical protein